MIHPDTELRFINEAIGYGVVAKKLIPKGTITWVQDSLDRVFSPADAKVLPEVIAKHLETYSFTNADGYQILCWDHAKYVNHSFNPSCMSTAYDFEIAIRDIHPGEELTDDYGYLNVPKPFEVVDEGADRKVVYPDDLLRLFPKFDQAIIDNLQNIKTVNQPLLKYIPDLTWIEFESVINGQTPLKSILTCYYLQL
jgi:hypothetical protein